MGLEKEIQILKRAIEREREARRNAETLLEEKSRFLFEANTKLSEQFTAINRKNAGLEFLHGVAKMIEKGFQFDSALSSFLEQTCTFCNWPVGHIFVPNSMGKLNSAKIWCLKKRGFDEFKNVTEGYSFNKGEGLPGRVFADDKPAWIPDLTTDTNFPRAKLLTSLKVKSAFAVPIHVSSEIGAIAEFFIDRTTLEDHSLIDIVATGAAQLGALLSKEQAQLQLLQSEKMASLGEMAGGMAHEINTPLGAITLSASQLKDLLPKELENKELIFEIVDDVLSSAERISRIIRGLKNFSRDSTKDGEFVFSDLVVLLKESLALCEMRMKVNGVTLELSEAPDKLDIQCNPSQVGQVIVNLVNNAGDAVSELQEKWVRVSLKCVGEMVELRITDSGKGIPKNVRDKLFQPFFTTKKIGSGTGLGLSIVHGIVKKHSGTIVVDENDPNTSFVVRIPRFRSL